MSQSRENQTIQTATCAASAAVARSAPKGCWQGLWELQRNWWWWSSPARCQPNLSSQRPRRAPFQVLGWSMFFFAQSFVSSSGVHPSPGRWLQGTEVSPKFPRFSKDVRPNAHLLWRWLTGLWTSTGAVGGANLPWQLISAKYGSMLMVLLKGQGPRSPNILKSYPMDSCSAHTDGFLGEPQGGIRAKQEQNVHPKGAKVLTVWETFDSEISWGSGWQSQTHPGDAHWIREVL